MRWRWWWLATGPLGFGVGLGLGHLGFTPWKVALGTGLVTGFIVVWILMRERRWFRQQAERVEQARKENLL